ncbi:hypothetical protein F0919_09210 [Taibaiella lutea]|uniref:DUF3575 domain-containing protein n=1 Tax=Taibaiella lutea TaxID=2608001 RepID=A0A5M6CID2_9BACT|nr:hypothetical protein [Taibaiella lutea]KAA5534776.1 hypothetical protein F0919_09210 [Taibaiella lutea]
MEKIRRLSFLALLSASTLFCLRTQAQSNSNVVNYQLLGDGLLMSIKYERKVLPDFNLWLNGGIGYYVQSGETYLTLPLGVRYWQPLSKHNRNYVGIGASATYCKADVTLYAIIEYRDKRDKPENAYINYIPALGFRHLNAKRQVTYTWEANLVVNNFAVLPYFGFSIGFAF